jgi:RNA polymerase-binding transcription factor DksA
MFSPSQLRELRVVLEKDFARILRSLSRREDSAAQDHLAAVTSALRRIDTDTYGECTRCGERISFGRLLVMPETTLCITCGSV